MNIRKPFLLLLFAAIFALGAVTPPKASAQVSVNFFYGNLHPYGEWVNCSYGYCWHPVNVAANWAPYTDGYWAYTDAGWTWVSYEDYGGIVYHYGRWVNIIGEGWVWVPGTVWAPAWVSWRSSPDYVGWAPLPPEATFSFGVGFGGWVDARFNIGPGCYNFVGVRDFGAPALGGVIVNREQNVTIINNTTNITNITTNNSTVYTGGPRYADIAARSSRPIPTLHLVRQGGSAAIAAAGGKILSHQRGNDLVVLAPHVTPPAGGKFPAPPYVAKTLAEAKPDHGWDIVKDPQQRADMQAKFKSEGGAYAPAKPVRVADVKLVDEKIKTQGAAKPIEAEEPKVTEKTGEEKPATEETAIKKTPKEKADETAAFENKPAAEGEATPGKLHKKKHPLEAGNGEYGAAGETPAPKLKKKKPETAEEEYDTPKHSNLEPFANGDEPKPKPKIHPEYPNGLGNGGEPGAVPRKKRPEGAATPF
jgi:hypothetical protein